MSLKDQIAFGKNTHLQKQFEQRCRGYQRTFKQNRRKVDVLEEECVTSLYGLLLDAKTHQGLQVNKQGEKSRPPSRQVSSAQIRRPESSREEGDTSTTFRQRPVSSISVRHFNQSYSFKRDGLDISQLRRKAAKADREAKEKRVNEIRNVQKQRPKSSIPVFNGRTSMSFARDEADGKRPNTACQFASRIDSLNRPLGTDPVQVKKVLQVFLPQEHPSSVNDSFPISGRQTVAFTNGTGTTQSKYGATSPGVNGAVKVPYGHSQESANANGADVYHSDDEQDITPQMNTDADEELEMLLSRENKENRSKNGSSTGILRSRSAALLRNKTEEIKRSKSVAILRRDSDDEGRLSSRQMRTGSSVPKDGEEEDLLEMSTVRTQSFLKKYSKKSKLYGYVVNAQASSASKVSRDHSIRTNRSPLITYQELVSIKANIVKHETQTRLMLKKSEEIKHFVERLATKNRTIVFD